MSNLAKSSGFWWILLPAEFATENYLVTDEEIERLDAVQLSADSTAGNISVNGGQALVLPGNGYDVIPMANDGLVGPTGILILLQGDESSMELIMDARPERWKKTEATLELPSGAAVMVDGAWPVSVTGERCFQWPSGAYTVFELSIRSARAVWLEPTA